MDDLSDHELLERYVRQGAEEAFATLVNRYLRLVYSTAYHSTGNQHQAQEISSAVFIILSRKAGQLSSRVVLAGWLYQTTRLTAANFIKIEIRRQRREQEAYMESISNESNPPSWERISPLLHQAMGSLDKTDRDAIVLRYFEDRSIAEIGLALRLNEAAARKRVNRAVEKLRRYFGKRGVELTAEGIGEAIATNLPQATPDGLAQAIMGAATANAAAGTSTLALVKGTLKHMAWTKAKMAIAICIGGLLAAGTVTVALEHNDDSSAEKYFLLLDKGLLVNGSMESGPLSNAPAYFIIRPTHYQNFGSLGVGNDGSRGINDSVWSIGRNEDLKALIFSAYGVFPYYYRYVFPSRMPEAHYDYLVHRPNGGAERFQKEIQKRFGYSAHLEMRNEDVWVMTVRNTNAMWLTRSGPDSLTISDNGSGRAATNSAPDQALMMDFKYYPFSNLVWTAENWLGKPVIDQTGLQGYFDVKLAWHGGTNELRQAIRDQWGLELTASNMPVEKFVVEKSGN